MTRDKLIIIYYLTVIYIQGFSVTSILINYNTLFKNNYPDTKNIQFYIYFP